jgi:hypothetical protein
LIPGRTLPPCGIDLPCACRVAQRSRHGAAAECGLCGSRQPRHCAGRGSWSERAPFEDDQVGCPAHGGSFKKVAGSGLSHPALAQQASEPEASQPRVERSSHGTGFNVPTLIKSAKDSPTSATETVSASRCQGEDTAMRMIWSSLERRSCGGRLCRAVARSRNLPCRGPDGLRQLPYSAWAIGRGCGPGAVGRVVEESPAFTAVAPNITPAGEVAAWSDAELARAISRRHRPDGSVIGPPMPIVLYRHLRTRT